ncbi:unnamed protein product [Urochloa decumbens]|uniref:Uncharacterized protein n=1 Tax=Urochloa decumbens TaxID=240449 RepID=A0ABC9AQI0_9POAL
MVSSGRAAGLKAAAAFAVFAVLVVSSQGHPRTKPLCSDCQSLCDANCTAMVIASCTEECNFQAGCDSCKSQVLQFCCQSFCSSSNDTSTVSSCCPSDCISGSCVSCSCDNCDTAAQNSCRSACSDLRCRACQNAVGQQCNISGCVADCNDHCVKKDC